MRYWVLAFGILALSVVGNAGLENAAVATAVRRVESPASMGAASWAAAKRLTPQGADVRATLDAISAKGRERAPQVAQAIVPGTSGR
jgi:hypothetical protein